MPPHSLTSHSHFLGSLSHTCTIRHPPRDLGVTAPTTRDPGPGVGAKGGPRPSRAQECLQAHAARSGIGPGPARAAWARVGDGARPSQSRLLESRARASWAWARGGERAGAGGNDTATPCRRRRGDRAAWGAGGAYGAAPRRRPRGPWAGGVCRAGTPHPPAGPPAPRGGGSGALRANGRARTENGARDEGRVRDPSLRAVHPSQWSVHSESAGSGCASESAGCASESVVCASESAGSGCASESAGCASESAVCASESAGCASRRPGYISAAGDTPGM